IFDVVDDIDMGWPVRVPGEVEVVAAQDIVPVEHVFGLQIGDHQVQVVYKLETGRGITRRIRPHQCYSQRLRLGGGLDGEKPRMLFAGGQGVGGSLVKHEHGRGGGRRRCQVREDARKAVGQIDQAPALVVNPALDLEIIKVSD